MAGFCIGIDLGGTFIKFVAMSAEGKLGELLQLATPPDGAKAVAAQMVEGAKKVMESSGISCDDCEGVGIGAPGPLSRDRGIIMAMPNIAGMTNVPLRDMVGEALSMPATLENDANAAAYGEFLCGAGTGARDMVLLTLGTGVGSGIIIDGRILHGAHEIGGEIGHMIVEPGGRECGCGQRGCLERYCSATYLATWAMHLIRDEGRESSLKAKLEAGGAIDSKDIEEAACAGDALASEVWDQGAYYLGLALVNICRIFDPDSIILAGGMTKAGETLMGPVRKHFSRLHWSLVEPRTELCLAALGNDAGAIGAAGVARLEFSR